MRGCYCVVLAIAVLAIAVLAGCSAPTAQVPDGASEAAATDAAVLDAATDAAADATVLDAAPDAAATDRISSSPPTAEPERWVRLSAMSDPVDGDGPHRYAAYTHCGLDYAFDIDGSLWDVVGEPTEDAIVLDDPHDEGTVRLVSEGTLTFTSRHGHIFVLQRREEPKLVASLCR